MKKKMCICCRKNKPISEYHKENDKKDGLCCYCKECKFIKFNANRKIYRENNKERLREVQKNYYDNNKEKELYRSARYRAAKQGIKFNITVKDVLKVMTDVCPVFGVKLIKNNHSRKIRSDSPSIDRIDPNKGYVKGNICIISYRANQIKSNGTIEEHEKVIEYMKKYGKKL